MPRSALPLALVSLLACAHGTGLSREEAQSRYSKLENEYFAEWFAFEPTLGTQNGFHQYDPTLEDFGAARVATHVQKLQGMLDRAVALWTERVALPYDNLIDLEALESRIRADLLEWEKMGFRLQNPMSYSRIPGEGIDALLKRDFAPASERLLAPRSHIWPAASASCTVACTGATLAKPTMSSRRMRFESRGTTSCRLPRRWRSRSLNRNSMSIPALSR